MPYAFERAAYRIGISTIWSRALVVSFILLQTVNFIWFSSLPASNNLQEMARHLLQITPAGEKIFIINDPLLGALVPPSQKYHLFQLTGVPLYGKNPLGNSPATLPLIVIYRNYIAENKMFLDPYADVIQKHYHAIDNLGQKGYTVLERNP